MPKISRLPLNKETWNRVFNLFIGTIIGIKDKKKLKNFVGDFFSPTERIMFAKRLAVAVLLTKGHNYQSIREILKISPSTIAKISNKVKFEGEGLNIVISDVLNKQTSILIWKEIEELFNFPTKSNLKSPERLKSSYLRKREIETINKEF